MSAENPPRSKQKTPEAFASNAEAYKHFREEAHGASGIFAELEKSLKTTRTVIAAERRKKKFKSQPLIDALVEEQTRLKTVKKELEKKIGWILSATVPGTSLGAPSFRQKREVPAEKGGLVEQVGRIPEQTGRFVLGERPVNIHGEKIGESPDTTRLMTPEELSTYISSLREKVKFIDPIQKIGGAHEVPRDMIRVEKPREVWNPAADERAAKAEAEKLRKQTESRVIELDTAPLSRRRIARMPNLPLEPEPIKSGSAEREPIRQEKIVPLEQQREPTAKELEQAEKVLAETMKRFVFAPDTKPFASEQEAYQAVEDAFNDYFEILGGKDSEIVKELTKGFDERINELKSQRREGRQEFLEREARRKIIDRERAAQTTAAAVERAAIRGAGREARDGTAEKRIRATWFKTIMFWIATSLATLGGVAGMQNRAKIENWLDSVAASTNPQDAGRPKTSSIEGEKPAPHVSITTAREGLTVPEAAHTKAHLIPAPPPEPDLSPLDEHSRSTMDDEALVARNEAIAPHIRSAPPAGPTS